MFYVMTWLYSGIEIINMWWVIVGKEYNIQGEYWLNNFDVLVRFFNMTIVYLPVLVRFFLLLKSYCFTVLHSSGDKDVQISPFIVQFFCNRCYHNSSIFHCIKEFSWNCWSLPKEWLRIFTFHHFIFNTVSVDLLVA